MKKQITQKDFSDIMIDFIESRSIIRNDGDFKKSAYFRFGIIISKLIGFDLININSVKFAKLFVMNNNHDDLDYFIISLN